MTFKATIDVEALVRWTYEVQCADVIIGSGVGLFPGEAYADGVWGVFGGGGDSYERVKRVAVLGCRVDGGGFRRGDLHPDAELVHDAVMALVVYARSAALNVLQFGIAGCRPDWREHAATRWESCETRRRRKGDLGPVYKHDPDRVPVYEYAKGAKGGHRPLYCPIRLIDHPLSIEYSRRVYASWHGGLVALKVVFAANQERLSAHTVTGPGVPAAPWKAQETTA